MSTPYFGRLFQDDYLKDVKDDSTATVSIDITIDGETETVTVTSEELVSLMQPTFKQLFQPLAKYRRVPRTILPPVELLSPTRYVAERDVAVLRDVVVRLLSDARTEVLSLVEKLHQSPMERLALLLGECASQVGMLPELVAVALEGEFEKCALERGSIMRGSSFAVQMCKLLVVGPEFSEYRKEVLTPALEEVAADGAQQPELGVTLRRVIDIITSNESVEKMPAALRHVCHILSELSEKSGLSEEERDGQVAGLVMLRFFNPAIISPAAHGVVLSPSAGAASSAVMARLKDLTRVLQKFSTGQAYAESNKDMEGVQDIMREMYPAFRSYLQRVCKEMRKEEVRFERLTLDLSGYQTLFEVLFSVPAHVKERGWDGTSLMIQDLRYVHKLQLFLQSDASYLAQAEKMEELLRKISAATVSAGDPFEAIYSALQGLTTWHASLFILLHDRLEVEWSVVRSARDWLHLVLLEIEDVYAPYAATFLFGFRNLVDISRDLKHGDMSESAELNAAITSLLTLVGRPLKRFGEVLAIISDAQLPPNHPDAKYVAAFMAQGKEVFDVMREQVSVSTVLEMGQIELQFEDKLELIKSGRKIVRQGFLMDEKGSQVEIWLFSDLILCGMPPQAGRKGGHKLLFKSPLSGIITRPVPGEESSFVVCVMAADENDGAGGGNGSGGGDVDPPAPPSGVESGARSARSKRISMTFRPALETKLTCSSVKQKGQWLADILGLQERLTANVRMSRKTVAREQLPSLTTGEWRQLVERGGQPRQTLEEGTVLLQAGNVNDKVYRVVSGRLVMKLDDLELSKLSEGGFAGVECLFQRDPCLYDVVVPAGGAVLECVPAATVLQDKTGDELLRHLFKSAAGATEALLRKVRVRHAANLVLQGKQRKSLDPVNVAACVFQALNEAEAAAQASGGGSYSKLDVTDLLLGVDPALFTTPSITSTWPKLLEMASYGKGAGTTLTSREHWVAVMAALENDKLISVSKEGSPTLSKRGRQMLASGYQGLDLPAALASCDEFFGLKGESLLAQFSVTSSKHMDRLSVSQHFFCLTGGRVLGLGSEKKQIVSLGHVVVCELRKKTLELVFAISIHQPPLKMTFKTQQEAVTAHALMRGKQRLASDVATRLYQSFPVATFPAGTVLTAPERPCVYVLGDVSRVHVMAKMAAGDLVLYTLDAGSAFVTDPAFFGLSDDAKQAWVCDANNEVHLTEVAGSALAESSELCVAVLKDLVSVQLKEMTAHLKTLGTDRAERSTQMGSRKSSKQ